MMNISQDQALQRWDSLPLILREALYSDTNSEFFWNTCEGQHVPEEKIAPISKLAGYVLLGFLHPDDLAREIREETGLPAQVADVIQESLLQRVFAPLKNDLEKIYQPSSLLAAAPSMTQTSNQDTGIPLPPLTPTMPPAPPLSSPGWSKMPAEAPASGEFDRLKNVRAVGVPGQPPAAGPAPMIIHQDAGATPLQKTPDFHLERPGANIAGVTLGGQKPAAPSRPAVLEFGGSGTIPSKMPPAPKPSGTSGFTTGASLQTPRVVHYTEFKPAAGRSVTEITDATPPSPPTPPPPKPPLSPAPTAAPITPKLPVPPIPHAPQMPIARASSVPPPGSLPSRPPLPPSPRPLIPAPPPPPPPRKP